jgi:hypothetical protein
VGGSGGSLHCLRDASHSPAPWRLPVQIVLLDADGSLAAKVAAALASSDAVPQTKIGFVNGGVKAWQVGACAWRHSDRVQG